MKPITLIASLLAIAWLEVPETVAAQPLSASVEAQLHLKVLGYDRAFRKRGKPVMAVVAAPTAVGAEDIASAFRTLSTRLTLTGERLTLVVVPFDANLASALKAAKATAIYTRSPPQLARLTQTAQALGIPVFTNDPALLQQGCAVAVHEANGRPKISVNARVAAAAGMDLDPRILAVSEVIR